MIDLPGIFYPWHVKNMAGVLPALCADAIISLPDFIPARIELVFIFQTFTDEVYDVSSIIESTFDRILLGDLYNAGNVVEETSDLIDTRYLITNDLERVTNNTFWVTGKSKP